MIICRLQCKWYTKGVPACTSFPVLRFAESSDWLSLLPLDNGCWKSFHTSVRQVKHPAPGVGYKVAGANSCSAPIVATPCLAAPLLVSKQLPADCQPVALSVSYTTLQNIHVAFVGELRNLAVDVRTPNIHSLTNVSRDIWGGDAKNDCLLGCDTV